MSAIETPPQQRYPWYVRLIFANQRRRYGQELEPAKLWGRTPKVFASLSLLYAALDRKASPLSPALRTLITVRVSQINWCAFCVDINAALGLERGATQEQFSALAQFESSSLFDEPSKAALAYAEAMTFSDRQVDAALMTRLKRQFSDEAIIELTALVAFQNLSSKFNSALDVPAQGFCQTAPQPRREPPPPVQERAP